MIGPFLTVAINLAKEQKVQEPDVSIEERIQQVQAFQSIEETLPLVRKSDGSVPPHSFNSGVVHGSGEGMLMVHFQIGCANDLPHIYELQMTP